MRRVSAEKPLAGAGPFVACRTRRWSPGPVPDRRTTGATTPLQAFKPRTGESDGLCQVPRRSFEGVHPCGAPRSPLLHNSGAGTSVSKSRECHWPAPGFDRHSLRLEVARPRRAKSDKPSDDAGSKVSKFSQRGDCDPSSVLTASAHRSMPRSRSFRPFRGADAPSARRARTAARSGTAPRSRS